MRIYYSKKEGGFFADEIHIDIPADAVEISETRYRSLLNGMAQGRAIVTGANGLPRLGDQPAASAPELAAEARSRRDRMLADSDKYVSVADFPISEPKRAEWVAYRALLRSITEQPAFPHAIEWPEVPSA